jgi:hypothetical protein
MLKLDVYSFGIVLWETWTRTLPYSGRPSAEVIEGLRHGMRPAVPEDCPEEYSALMQRCWDKDANKRPEFDEISEELAVMIEAEDKIIEEARSKRAKAMQIPAFGSGGLAAKEQGERPPRSRASTTGSSVPAGADPRRSTAAAADHAPTALDRETTAGVSNDVSAGAHRTASMASATELLDVTSSGMKELD